MTTPRDEIVIERTVTVEDGTEWRILAKGVLMDCLTLAQLIAENEKLRSQLTAATNQLESIKGALADAGGNVLAGRLDGDYAASVRELTQRAEAAERERDRFRERYGILGLSDEQHEFIQHGLDQARITALESQLTAMRGALENMKVASRIEDAKYRLQRTDEILSDLAQSPPTPGERT